MKAGKEENKEIQCLESLSVALFRCLIFVTSSLQIKDNGVMEVD